MGCGNSSKKIDTPLIKKEEPRIKAPEEVKDAEDLNYKELAQLQEIIFGKADVEKAR